MRTSKSGFTIVELLIVIVVIGILAAITIVAYNGIQTRAENSKTVAGTSQAVKLLKLYKETNGDYPSMVSSAGLNCLGRGYTSNTCLTGADGVTPQAADLATFNTALETMGSLPSPSTKNITLNTGQVAAGANFQYATKMIRYHLSGSTATCDAGGTTHVYGTVTQCRITLD